MYIDRQTWVLFNSGVYGEVLLKDLSFVRAKQSDQNNSVSFSPNSLYFFPLFLAEAPPVSASVIDK